MHISLFCFSVLLQSIPFHSSPYSNPVIRDTPAKAKTLLGLINKCFINLTPLTFSCLYNTIVRPILEYENIVW